MMRESFLFFKYFSWWRKKFLLVGRLFLVGREISWMRRIFFDNKRNFFVFYTIFCWKLAKYLIENCIFPFKLSVLEEKRPNILNLIFFQKKLYKFSIKSIKFLPLKSFLNNFFRVYFISNKNYIVYLFLFADDVNLFFFEKGSIFCCALIKSVWSIFFLQTFT